MPEAPVNVYLTDADLNAPVAVTLGIRAAIQVLDPNITRSAALSAAEALWEKFEGGTRPTLLGWAENEAQAREAASAALDRSSENVKMGIGLSDDEVDALRKQHADMKRPEPPERATPTGDFAPMSLFHLLGPDAPTVTDDDMSIEAGRTAITLLAMFKGSGTDALIWARVLRVNTGDELYDEVATLLLACLPLSVPSGASE